MKFLPLLLVACAAASKNEFVEVKFELFDLCENYALDGCQRPVPVDGEGSKGVIPYPGLEGKDGTWYFKDEITYFKDESTIMAKIRLAHDPKRDIRRHVIMKSIDGKKFLQFEEVEKFEELTSGSDRQYRFIRCVSEEPEHDSEAEQILKLSAPSKLLKKRVPQVEKVFSAHIRNNLKGFGHVGVDVASLLQLMDKYGDRLDEHTQMHKEVDAKTYQHPITLASPVTKKACGQVKADEEVLSSLRDAPGYNAEGLGKNFVLQTKHCDFDGEQPKSLYGALVVTRHAGKIQWPSLDMCGKSKSTTKVLAPLLPRKELGEAVKKAVKQFGKSGSDDEDSADGEMRADAKKDTDQLPDKLADAKTDIDQSKGSQGENKTRGSQEEKGAHRSKEEEGVSLMEEIINNFAEIEELRHTVEAAELEETEDGGDDDESAAATCQTFKTWTTRRKKHKFPYYSKMPYYKTARSSECTNMKAEVVGKDYRRLEWLVNGPQKNVDTATDKIMKGLKLAIKLESKMTKMIRVATALDLPLALMQYLPYVGKAFKVFKLLLKNTRESLKKMEAKLKAFNKNAKTKRYYEKACSLRKKNEGIAAKIVKYTSIETKAIKPLILVDHACGTIGAVKQLCTKITQLHRPVTTAIDLIEPKLENLESMLRVPTSYVGKIAAILDDSIMKAMSAFFDFIDQVLSPFTALIEKKISVTVPIPGIAYKNVCVTIWYPCGVKWCGGWFKYPCGVRLCSKRPCTNIPYPTITMTKFSFSVGDIIRGALSVIGIVTDALMSLVKGIIPPLPSLAIPLPNMNLPSPDLPSLDVDLIAPTFPSFAIPGVSLKSEFPSLTVPSAHTQQQPYFTMPEVLLLPTYDVDAYTVPTSTSLRKQVCDKAGEIAHKLTGIAAPPAVTRDIKLVGGSSSAGNVYLNKDGAWRPVCDDDWDENDARVACRQLGFSGGATHKKYSYFGRVDTNFVMDDVHCQGTESNLWSCTHKSRHNCGSHEAAGVQCSGSQSAGFLGESADLEEYPVPIDDVFLEEDDSEEETSMAEVEEDESSSEELDHDTLEEE